MIAILFAAFVSAAQGADVVPCAGQLPRRSPCMPGDAERGALMTQISTAIRLHDEWLKSKAKEAELRNRLSGGRSENYQDWRGALGQLKSDEIAMRQSFSYVTKSVQESYGVGASKRTGKVKGGLLDGETAVWSPIIQERESLVYKVDRPGKKPVYLSYSEDEDTLGQTLNDGGVIISYKVLKLCADNGSPARLAEVIAHEAIHFDGLVSKNGLSGYNSTEASAYARSIEVGGMIGLDKRRQDEVAILHSIHYSTSLANELGGIAGVPYRALPHSNDYPYQRKSDAYLKDWQTQSKRVGEILRQREELVRRHEGADQVAVDRSGGISDACGYPGMSMGGVDVPPIPCPRTIYTPPLISAPVQPAIPPVVVPVVPAPPPFDIWGALKALALQGCTRPGTVTQHQLDVLWPKIFGMAYYPDAGAELGLTGCQAALLNRVVRWAADYKPGTFQLQTFEYEAGMARGDARTIESEPPERPRRDYPMPGSEPCLDGRATCGPVYPKH